MLIEEEFAIGSIVYLKTDTDQHARIVTGYRVRPNSSLIYLLSCGPEETEHFSIELTETKNILISS